MKLKASDFIKEIAINPNTCNTTSANLSISKYNNNYYIKSYNAIIAKKEGNKWFVTTRKYSVTTSKHTSYCRKYLPNVVEEYF